MRIQPRRLLDFVITLHERRRHRRRGERILKGLVADFRFHHETINAIGLFVKAIIADLVQNVEENQQAASHADSKAGNVDEGISLVTEQISTSDFEVVFEHDDLQA